MIRAKLLYAALIVVMMLFFILYRGNLSFELLIFTLVFPLFLLVNVIWLKRAMKTGIYHSQEPILKGQVFFWIFQIKNPSIFSSPEARLTLEYRNSLTGNVQEVTFTVPVVSCNVQRIRMGFHAVTCGIMQITVKKLVIYDPLRLFHATLRLKQTDTVVIMPAPNVVLPSEWPPQPKPDADTNEYAKDRPGDDPSEIFDLHQYREGDPVSRIHWKLSSKLDTLMVKEYSLPLSAGCLMLSDYRHISKEPDSPLRVDAMLSAVSAAAMQLSTQGSSFALTSYHPKAGIQCSDLYTALPDAIEWMRQTVKNPPVQPDDRPALLQAMRDFLMLSHPYDRIILFTPQLDLPLQNLLAEVSEPERFMIFAVTMPGDAPLPENLIREFRLVPVLPAEPRHPSPEELRGLTAPEFDEEILVQGGAEP